VEDIMSFPCKGTCDIIFNTLAVVTVCQMA